MSQEAQPGMTVLHICSIEGERAALRNLFSHSNWELRQVRTVDEGILALTARPVPVIIVDRYAPGGGWRAVLGAIWEMASPPAVIVFAGDPDATFWAGALEHGAYDVLWRPMNAAEVFAVVQCAWRARQEAARREQNQMSSRRFRTAS